MSMNHQIDCHVLTMPTDSPEWSRELRTDLDGEPVNQFWIEGIPGKLGAARAAGYQQGSAPFLSYADPDDRVTPGIYTQLLDLLLAHPNAPFAWAGEQVVNEALEPIMPANTWSGYHPASHKKRANHVHGVMLYRRSLVEPQLEKLMHCGIPAEHMLSMAIAQPWEGRPRECWPVHLPLVGRLWRWHGQNYHRRCRPQDVDNMAQLLGFKSFMELVYGTGN
jgi:hypothetical protein